MITLVITVVKCEPPNVQYGTPLAAPINNYGATNYNGDGHNHEYNEVRLDSVAVFMLFSIVSEVLNTLVGHGI